MLGRLEAFGKSLVGDDRGWKTRFAEKLEISSQQLSNILTDRDALGPAIREKLRALGCDTEWLMTGDEHKNKVAEEQFPYGKMMPVQVLGRIKATPEGKQVFEDIKEDLTVPYFRGNYFALIIENDSLINAPEGDHSMELYPGDVAIFEVGRQPKNGDIVAVQMEQNNTRMVKIFKHDGPNNAQLLSANKFRNYLAVKIKKDQVATFGIFVTKLKLTRAEKRKLGIKD